MATSMSYPVRVEGRLDPHLSRWLWLAKWLLAIPHYVALFFLWTAFAVLSVLAFFAIAFTGRYPPTLFEFNLGVMRWSWRVAYYAYGALGTDRYPPFTLADVPDYPARLAVAYPEHLSRGLVWVKWWLLAIPHYVVVGLLLGGAWFAGRTAWVASGLLGILVIIAAIALAFTGRYPRPLFDFILGLNRWVIRVAAYAGLMTDEYPPFRLDQGGDEPAGTLTVRQAPLPSAPGSEERGWTAGRITALTIGAVLMVASLGMLIGGGIALWADRTQRDAAGFLVSNEERFATDSYALTTTDMYVDVGGADVAGTLLGDIRVRITPIDPDARIFVGIAHENDVASYLGDVERAIVRDVADGSNIQVIQGTAPATLPASKAFWEVSSEGAGTQSLTWSIQGGSWVLVAMNAGAEPGIDIEGDIAATLPALPWLAMGLLAGGAVFVVIASSLIIVPVMRAGRRPITETTDVAEDRSDR